MNPTNPLGVKWFRVRYSNSNIFSKLVNCWINPTPPRDLKPSSPRMVRVSFYAPKAIQKSNRKNNDFWSHFSANLAPRIAPKSKKITPKPITKTGRLSASISFRFSLILDEQKPRKKASRLHAVLISQFTRFPNQVNKLHKNGCQNQLQNDFETQKNDTETSPRKSTSKMIDFGSSGVPKINPILTKM